MDSTSTENGVSPRGESQGFLGGKLPSEMTRSGFFFGKYPADNVLFPEVRGFGEDVTSLCKFLLERHAVATVPGAARWFGPRADGHIRLVFSTSESIWRKGLERVVAGLEQMSQEGRDAIHGSVSLRDA